MSSPAPSWRSLLLSFAAALFFPTPGTAVRVIHSKRDERPRSFSTVGGSGASGADRGSTLPGLSWLFGAARPGIAEDADARPGIAEDARGPGIAEDAAAPPGDVEATTFVEDSSPAMPGRVEEGATTFVEDSSPAMPGINGQTSVEESPTMPGRVDSSSGTSFKEDSLKSPGTRRAGVPESTTSVLEKVLPESTSERQLIQDHGHDEDDGGDVFANRVMVSADGEVVGMEDDEIVE